MLKYSIGLLLLTLYLLQLVWSERDYSVVVQRVELDEECDEYLGNKKIRLTKFNQSAAVINGTVDLLQDIPNEAVMDILGYEKNGNTYSDSAAVNISQGVCNYITNDKMIYPDVVEVSNFPKLCPAEKGSFWVKNFVLKDEVFPEKVPGDDWRFDVKLFNNPHERKKLLASSWFIHIDRTAAVRKKKGGGGNSKGSGGGNKNKGKKKGR